MVDNFDLIEDYMKSQLLDWQEGDCYYVQLLRRAADDPMKIGVKDKKYHGNMHSRSIKDYLIRSVEHLEDVKEQIKAFCELENVRAYIRLNKRNYKNIALEMLKHIAEQAASGESFSSPFHLISSACGTCCQASKNKKWLVDLDKEYLPYEEDIVNIICECEPNIRTIENYQFKGTAIESEWNSAKQWFIKDNFFRVPTKNGRHLICKPFNKQMFEVAWNKFLIRKGIELKMPDIHKDNPTILYVP